MENSNLLKNNYFIFDSEIFNQKSNRRYILIKSILLSFIITIIIISVHIYDKKNNKHLDYINKIILNYNDNYKLTNLEKKYSFKGIYESKENDNVILINRKYKNIIKEMEIDEEEIIPTTNYTFKTSGNHTIYILINITNLEKLDDMFYNIDKLTSIYFTKE